MNRKIIVLGLIVLISLTGPGCWDIKDITERAFVTAIALDISEQGNTPQYKVTVSIPQPIKIKSRTQDFLQSFTTEADSITKAMQKLQTEISRTISFHHLRAVLIEGKLATQKDFRDLSSFFSKNPDLALRTRLFFVQDEEAKEFFNNKPQFERSIVAELVSFSQSGKQLSLTRTNRYADFLQDLQNNNGTALGAKLTSTKNKEGEKTIVDGGAVFKDWKLVGWLNGEEIQGANLLMDNQQFIVNAEMGGGQYSYLADNVSKKIKPVKNGSQIQFYLELKTKGIVLEERKVYVDFSDPKNISDLEKVLSKIVKKQLEGAIYKSQKEFETDYLGFGKAFKNKYPKEFKKIKDWNKIYPEVPINVQVEAKISRFGTAK